MRLDDSVHGPLRLLESLEAVQLGINGKLALWRPLIAAAEVAPARGDALDYQSLAKRATEQIGRVEAQRVKAEGGSHPVKRSRSIVGESTCKKYGSGCLAFSENPELRQGVLS